MIANSYDSSEAGGRFPMALRDEKDPELLALAAAWHNAVEGLRALDSALPSHQISALLMVYQKEGLQVGEYARLSGISQSTMSRHLLDLGEKRRDGTPGLGLLRRDHSLTDLRAVGIYLTPKGRALMDRVLRTLGRTKIMASGRN